jgi:hypothetical protein
VSAIEFFNKFKELCFQAVNFASENNANVTVIKIHPYYFNLLMNSPDALNGVTYFNHKGSMVTTHLFGTSVEVNVNVACIEFIFDR